MSILILLGNGNDEEGRLSPIAKARCDLAVELLRENQEMKVLPTGAFGKHFNRSERAHGYYITKYLTDSGISKERILPYTNSSNTLEDALCARKVVIDSDEKELVIVTSDFHMQRVKYIFLRIFRDFRDIPLTFREARSPVVDKELRKLIKKEKCALDKLQREWIDVPLYEKQAFPTDVYNGAASDQKHYDTVSLAVVTGMVIAFAYPFYAKDSLMDMIPAWVPFLVAAFLIFWLFLLYKRLARTAVTARQTMHWIEVGFGQPGFSTSYYRQHFVNIRLGITRMVLLAAVTMVLLDLAASCIAYITPPNTRLERDLGDAARPSAPQP
jgi:Uncharacterized conserved protein